MALVVLEGKKPTYVKPFGAFYQSHRVGDNANHYQLSWSRITLYGGELL